MIYTEIVIKRTPGGKRLESIHKAFADTDKDKVIESESFGKKVIWDLPNKKATWWYVGNPDEKTTTEILFKN